MKQKLHWVEDLSGFPISKAATRAYLVTETTRGFEAQFVLGVFETHEAAVRACDNDFAAKTVT